MTSSVRIRKVSAAKGSKSTPRNGSSVKSVRKGSPEHKTGPNNANPTSEDVNETNASDSDSEFDEAFEDHSVLGDRVSKTLYFANRLPSTPRPSFPLTVLAVNAFTNGALGTQVDSLEFLDLEMASEIGRSACVTPTALIMALVYLDRLSQNNPNYLTSVKPSELFVVALLVASKFMQDDGEECAIYNDEWASSARMDVKRVNKLELGFLDAIDWRVNVNLDEYNKVLEKVEEALAVDQGISRGWFTYTELERLSAHLFAWKSIWPTVYAYVVQVITAASITYTALIATMLTSSIFIPQLVVLTKGLMTPSNLVTSNLTPLDLTHQALGTKTDLNSCTECVRTDLDLSRFGRNESLVYSQSSRLKHLLRRTGHYAPGSEHGNCVSQYGDLGPSLHAHSVEKLRHWDDVLGYELRTKLSRHSLSGGQYFQHQHHETSYSNHFYKGAGIVINM